MRDHPGIRRPGARAFMALLIAAAGLGLSTIPRARLAEAEIPVVEPSAATDGRVRIPSLGLDAPLGAQRVARDGTMPMPYGPVDVAWYDFSLHPGMGGVPLTSGNTILSGHVDFAATVPYTGVRYAGPAVFADLARLRPGAVVELTRAHTVTYRVVSVEILAAAQAEWLAQFASTPVEMLTLFTCIGTFNPRTADYSDRLVVKAVRVIGEARRLDSTPDQRFLYGTGGTSDPLALLAAQTRPVTALYAKDPEGASWLMFVPGAPSFINTLTGRLRPDVLVIGRVAPAD